MIERYFLRPNDRKMVRSRKATLQLPFSPRPPSSSTVRERIPSSDTARRFWDEVWKMSQKKVDYVW